MDSKQIIYILLILPTLFGLIFFGYGISKIIHLDKSGYVNLIVGVGLLAVVGVAFLHFSGYF